MIGRLPALSPLLGQDDGALFLGDDFFPWMVLAFGAAMVVGNVLAMVRPPAEAREDPDHRPPVGRSLVLIAVGVAAGAWGLASLLA